ncbi:MAG: hypothetical protein GXP38_08165 [Chloroflexi bacterium]|nr:hypothetical protein [Chloroflexota bacterium]
MPNTCTPTIVICDPIHADGIDRLRQIGHVISLDRRYSPEELIEVAREADALIVRSRTHVPAEVINNLSKLKVIGRAGAGLDTIDVSAARARGVSVVNAPDANTVAVAEHTIGLMISLARHIPAADASLKQGYWHKSKLLGVTLYGKTLGIIGFGRIGREVAKRAAAFGMRIIVNQPRLTPELALAAGAEPHDLYDLLAEADFVSIHIPLRPQNKNLIGARELALMKPQAYLINTARGGIVDEEALLATLRAGHLAGVAIDVFASEPTPNLELVQHPRVIATPHIAASAREAQRDAALTVAEKVAEILDVWQSSAGSLNLRVVPLDQVVTHESVDPKRVQRLRKRLSKDGTLSDPPVVAFWDGKYVVLDGATRTSTLREMGFEHIIVQTTTPDQDVQLHTWNHAVSNLDFDAFLAAIADIPHLHVEEVTQEEAETRLLKGSALSYIHHPTRGFIALQVEAPTWLEQLDVIRDIVDVYSRLGNVERTLVTDISRLQHDFPDLTMSVVFRPLEIKEILQAASYGHPMPAGVTRFVVLGRILRLNAPLDELKKPGSLSEKNRWLQRLLTHKLARSGVRYYQEPVFLLDE